MGNARWSLLGASALAALLAASPAGADWLVLRDGSRVETHGPWRVDGRLVVFTRADGGLASLRQDDVDLAASRRATAEAGAAKPAAPPSPASEAQPRQPVRRLTNADIPQGRPQPPAGATPAEGESSAAADQEPASARSTAAELLVVQSRQDESTGDGHVVVTGTLANASPDIATAIRLAVRVFGPEGRLIGDRPATLERSALPPGEETGFRAEFPDVFAAFAVTFQPNAVMLLAGEAPEAGSTSGAGSSEPPPEP